MPRPTQLPTPMASTEIMAQDGSKALSMAIDLELPPSAFESTRSPSLSEDSEYTPPSSKSKASRRSSSKRSRDTKEPQGGREKEQITLPPPPGRSRKIIEMKPSTSSSKPKSEQQANLPVPAKKSAASRKISRKTAHSLIERRRRGKMNDEFDVLKEMIPACESSGREMHKLEILKASVEYIRYLKECVCKLQGESGVPCCPPQMTETAQEATGQDEDTDTDVEMEMSTPEQGTPRAIRKDMEEAKIDPQLVILPYNPPPTPKLSPAILPQPDRTFSLSSVTSPLSIAPRSSYSDQRHFSFSSTGTQNQLHAFSFSEASALTQSFAGTRNGSTTSSTFTSPLLAAQREADQDATVALLMLNGEWPSRGHMGSRDEPRVGSLKQAVNGFGNPKKLDREEGMKGQERWGGRTERRRGLSVKDLLSS